MATADAETSRDEQVPPGGLVYDGFISYSHAADDLLAPRLQTGLQRFAKPWWKRRALRIFRDESSLSANPHLWSSITDALDQSDWFVLLLSPDAADSEWVNQEVEYWLEHKDPGRIIPVVTDGDFTWTDGDFVSDAAPPALRGAFSNEPRWVDLRFAGSEEQLDLNNPRFSAAVADIASAVRGVPKDELESEEVRQHRRTVRTAWAAGIVVLLLALAAGGAALFALDQRNEAVTNAEKADQNAAEADKQRQLAEENAEAAQVAADAEAVAREEAVRSASLARGNELALRAEKEIPVDAERAMLLAIEAIGLAREAGVEPIEAARSLRTALTSSRILHRILGGQDWAFVAVAADGSLLATESESGTEVNVWDTTTWELVGTFAEPAGNADAAAFDSEADRLAVRYTPVVSDSDVSPVVVYPLAGGPGVHLEGDSVPVGGDVRFAAGGDVIVAHFYVEDEDRGGVGAWSAATGERLLEFEEYRGNFDVDPSGERVAIRDGFGNGRIRIYDVSTGAVLVDVGGSESNTSIGFSPDGSRLAETSQDLTRLLIRDASSGAVLHDWQIDRIAGVAWLDESRVAVGGEGSTRVVDTDTGEVLFELAGHKNAAFQLAAVPGSSWLATGGYDRAVLIWDVSPDGLTELPLWDTGLADTGHFAEGADGSYVLNPSDATWWVADEHSEAVVVAEENAFMILNKKGTLGTFVRPDGTSGVVSVPEGEVVYEAPEGLEVHGVSDDGDLVVLVEPFDDLRFFMEQVPLVVETDTGREVGRLPPQWEREYQFSPDSSLIFHFCCGTEATSVYLGPDWEPSGTFVYSFMSRISDSGRLLAFPPGDEYPGGEIWLLDTDKLQETRDIESSRVARIAAQSGLIFPDFSDDETMFATTAFDEPIRVWDISGVLDGQEPTLIAEIEAEPRSGPPNVYFSPDGTRIVSRSVDGLLRQFIIDADELIDLARARLTRSLTFEECATYGINPCPTLEDIKSGSA
jgi:WD40 repeat protein